MGNVWKCDVSYRGRLFEARFALTHAGLVYSPLCWLVYFCASVYFQTLESKTCIGPDKISEIIFPSLYTQAVRKFVLKFYVNL